MPTKKESNVEKFRFTYKIYNSGPSSIKELILTFQIPSTYILKLNHRVSIVDLRGISAKGFYINKVHEATWSDNIRSLIEDSTDDQPQLEIEDHESDSLSDDGFNSLVSNQIKEQNNSKPAMATNSSQVDDLILKNLPKNQTIFFECATPNENVESIEANFTIHNFKPGSDPISITLNIPIDVLKICELNNFQFNQFFYIRFQLSNMIVIIHR